MEILKAVILALVQGFTEFLPISSSGHLVLAERLLGFTGPNLAFDILLHLGTTFAVLIYFRNDIVGMLVPALTGANKSDSRRWIIMIILATIPTGIIGVLFKEQLEAGFNDVHAVAIELWITGLLLVITDRIATRSNPGNKVKTHQSLIVGIAQGISIIPGISRSGATISAGVFTGLNRDTAARFSFLLSIPAVLGACVLNVRDLQGIAQIDVVSSAAGLIVSFLSGYLAISLLLKMLVRRDLWKFAVYLFLIGLVALVWL